MANRDNPSGFHWVRNLIPGSQEPLIDYVTLNGTVTKGDTLVIASGVATIGLSNTGSLLGVAAESGVSGDVIAYYPAVPWAVFEGQCSGTFAVTSHLHAEVDMEGTTGIQEVNEDATTEKVFHIIGYNPNDSVGANTRVQFTIVKSQYTGLEDAET